ncbi:MAG: hypothetical protein ACREDF_08935, partial [Thermoplasmata archaeon]
SPVSRRLFVGLGIGILLLVGMLALHASLLVLPPVASTGTQYENTIRALGWTLFVTMDLAVALTVMIAWFVSPTNANVSDQGRRGIFIFAAVFLAVWLLVGLLPLSLFLPL